MADTQERVTQLLVRQFNISEGEVNPETSFLDLTDSFGIAEFAAAVETEFQCSIREDEEAYAIENVGQLVSYLDARSG
ncbi:MAG: phosphopantetheine-binding protein [Chloroflexi bacterium]|nr:phosphopantetheine-binding protein [Chloroflexota bacterium]